MKCPWSFENMCIQETGMAVIVDISWMRNNGSVLIKGKYLCRFSSRNLGSSQWSSHWSHNRDDTRVIALIGHLSEWQFNWRSNKDAFKLTAIILNNLLLSAMVGLEIRPVAKLNHNRIEVLPKDGKEGRRGGWKQEGANAGMYTVVRSFNRAMKLIASWKRG